MRIRYLDWKVGIGRLADRLKLLRRLFAVLLVQEDGDAERALELLSAIGDRYGLFDEDLSFEDFRRSLIEGRLIAERKGGAMLTPRGERFVRTESLDQIFGGLRAGLRGQHPSERRGRSGEATGETRSWSFGDDPSDIDFASTWTNALRRPSEGTPFLEEEDLRVHEREEQVSVATALLLDTSHSMVLYGEDRITPAKRVALALVELLRTRYPRDALHVILFGDTAREVPIRELTYVGAGPYHTNTKEALRLARSILLRKKHTNRQIFLVTDGKPTALFEDGKLRLNPFGLDPKIVAKTLDEAAECRRQCIPITTFMLAQDPLLVRFVERLTQVNRGRAFFSSIDGLEKTLFVDYIRNRQRRLR